MKKRICIVDGVRTPMAKAGTLLKDIQADELAVHCVKHLANKHLPHENLLDEVIFGNVAMPFDAPNIGRVIALKSGLPESIPAYSIQRNCASGMEAIITAFDQIQLGRAQTILAGGTESMSNIPFIFSKKAQEKLTKLSYAKTLSKKLKALLRLSLKDFKPTIALIAGLTDPVSGNIMGKTAEHIARELGISRESQDQYALQSHQRALDAEREGYFLDEIIPIPQKPHYKRFIETDNGIDGEMPLSKLQKLRPYFDRLDGTVTVGNACQITDGAAATLVCDEEIANKYSYKPIGYIKAYAHAGLEPDRMGLGPAYAIHKLLAQNGKKLTDYDLFEMNEAFAGQVLANLELMKSDGHCKRLFKRSKALGEIPQELLNVNGGAISLGHPVGMSGTRIIIHLLKEMQRRNLKTGIASLCVGGGQGVAVELEL